MSPRLPSLTSLNVAESLAQSGLVLGGQVAQSRYAVD